MWEKSMYFKLADLATGDPEGKFQIRKAFFTKRKIPP